VLQIVLTAPPRWSYTHLADALVLFLFGSVFERNSYSVRNEFCSVRFEKKRGSVPILYLLLRLMLA